MQQHHPADEVEPQEHGQRQDQVHRHLRGRVQTGRVSYYWCSFHTVPTPPTTPTLFPHPAYPPAPAGQGTDREGQSVTIEFSSISCPKPTLLTHPKYPSCLRGREQTGRVNQQPLMFIPYRAHPAHNANPVPPPSLPTGTCAQGTNSEVQRARQRP